MFRIVSHNNDFYPAELQSMRVAKRSRDFQNQRLVEDRAKAVLTETVIDDEEVHLQSAHDCLRSRITKCKREGKDCKALEAKLASLAGLIGKKD